MNTETVREKQIRSLRRAVTRYIAHSEEILVAREVEDLNRFSEVLFSKDTYEDYKEEIIKMISDLFIAEENDDVLRLNENVIHCYTISDDGLMISAYIKEDNKRYHKTIIIER